MAFDFQPVPRGIRTLIIITVAVWVVQLLPFAGGAVTQWCSLVPFQTFGRGQLWRLLTYPFLHDPSGPFHVLFNMLTLWMFGGEIEEMWGTRRFTVFYLASGAGAGLFSLFTFVSPALWFTPVIGASGAVLALLTVYALYFPGRQLYLFFLVPVNVIVAVVIFGLISLFGAMRSFGNVSHITHLGGIVVGVLYVKAGPFISSFFENAKARAEAARRNAAERKKNAERDFFENTIDPILRKISASGMGSLTKEEKKTLEEASKRKRRGDADDDRPVLFRKNG